MSKNIWTPHRIGEIEAMRAEGMNYNQIGKAMGLNPGSLQVAARRHGIQVANSPWNPERDAKITELRLEGLTMKAIAEKVGVTWRSVAGRLRLLDLTSPRPKGVRLGGFAMVANPEPKPPRAIVRDVAWSPLPNTTPLDLTAPGGDQGCRWPIDWLDGSTRFCCAPQGQGVYCAEHRAIGVRPSESKTRRAA